MSAIEFIPLYKDHFSYLLNWLKMPHVHRWYDQDQVWDMDNIKVKYENYTQGFKIIGHSKKNIYSYIIYFIGKPIGYIQYYNAYDFPHDGFELKYFPPSLAALDVFIGEKNYLGKGIGSQTIRLFLTEHVIKKFKNCLVDPKHRNINATKAFKRAGFNEILPIFYCKKNCTGGNLLI